MLDRPDSERPLVGLFVTCLVDAMRPTVGFAAVRLLERAGCRVVVPASQTCCGQPAYNSGDDSSARRLAEQMITAFEDVDYVVAPSGSCAGTIKHHYPAMFADRPQRLAAVAIADKTYELTSFLTDVIGFEITDAEFDGTVTYHDSCSGLREMGVRDQPRALLEKVNGLILKEGNEAEACCGFGGLFCVKYPDISARMSDAKIDDIVSTGAGTVLGGDLGCLITVCGRLKRRGVEVQARHVAEVLAGMADGPAIGEGSE